MRYRKFRWHIPAKYSYKIILGILLHEGMIELGMIVK